MLASPYTPLAVVEVILFGQVGGGHRKFGGAFLWLVSRPPEPGAPVTEHWGGLFQHPLASGVSVKMRGAIHCPGFLSSWCGAMRPFGWESFSRETPSRRYTLRSPFWRDKVSW